MVAVDKKLTEADLSEKEKNLLELIRGTGYGEISLIIQEYEPVVVEEVIKKIKL
ncbi:MAG: DUF2292 domain-containing protein [Peptococcaceae bacterium]|nr:DUF2292 domain-containing protein [Peptococcaceae bacterium]